MPQTAIVTGAGSGLGRAFALRLAREGWTICIADIVDERIDAVCEEVRAGGGEARPARLDVTDFNAWQNLVAELQTEWSQLDLLVNNAGVAASGVLQEFSIEDFHWIVNINMWGVVYGCKACVDWLVDNPQGAIIINVASLAAIATAPSMIGYNLTKSAVVSVSRTLHGELRDKGVHVSALCPGFFKTNLLEEARMGRPEERRFAEREFNRGKMSADDVAAYALEKARAKRLMILPHREGRALYFMDRMMPETVRKLAAMVYKRQLGRE